MPSLRWSDLPSFQKGGGALCTRNLRSNTANNTCFTFSLYHLWSSFYYVWSFLPLWCPGHAMPVRSLCFSPDSLLLVTASDDREMKIYDM